MLKNPCSLAYQIEGELSSGNKELNSNSYFQSLKLTYSTKGIRDEDYSRRSKSCS